MPSEGTKILKFNQYQKSEKLPFVAHADLECIMENIDVKTAKVREHIS